MQFFFKPKSLNNYSDWVFYNNVFNKEECDAIKSLFKNYEKATIIKNDTLETGVYSEIRSSMVSWIDYSQDVHWIYERISKFVHDCNNARYNFDITGFDESMQLAKYEVNDYFNWHQDMGAKVSRRKLSVVVQLSEPSEYEGGQLEFCGSGEAAPNKLGDLIVFPSYLSHRVAPIASGTRYSLVAWISGPPYR